MTATPKNPSGTREVTAVLSSEHMDFKVTLRPRNGETPRELWDLAGRIIAAADQAADQGDGE